MAVALYYQMAYTGSVAAWFTDGTPTSYSHKTATEIRVPVDTVVTITSMTFGAGMEISGSANPTGGIITYSIYGDAGGGLPNMSDLKGKVGELVSATTTASAVRSSDFDDVVLEAGTYWLVTETSSDATGFSNLHRRYHGSASTVYTASPQLSAYTGNSALYYKNGSWAWHTYPNLVGITFTLYGDVAGGDPPSKATNPSPSDETENDGCFDNKLSWSGDGDDYDVYIGTSAETLGIIASGTTSNPYTVSEEDFPTNSVVYWRIDSNNDAGTTEGDVWSFDPSPGIATNPTPSDGQGRVSPNQSRLYWDGGKLYQTFDVYIDGYLAEEDTTNEYYDLNDYDYWPLLGGTAYTWSVTAKNAHGETEGDTWSFTTGARYAPITPRPLDYDEDLGWDVPNGEWAPIGDLDVAGGGSLQSQIVVIGHKVIYFGTL